MFCQKCGFQNEEGVNFCAKCGADLREYQNAAAAGRQPDAQPPEGRQPNGQPPYGQPPYAPQPNGGQYADNPQGYSQNPGSPYPYNAPGTLPPVNSHMVMSVISLFFCLILGIIAIVFSSKSKSCYNMGDYNGAVSNANTAKVLGIVGIVVGIVITFLYIVAIVGTMSTIQ